MCNDLLLRLSEPLRLFVNNGNAEVLVESLFNMTRGEDEDIATQSLKF